MSSLGVGRIVIIDGIMTGAKYVKLLQETLFASAIEMGLNANFTFQQDNDPKHTCDLATKFFQNSKINMLEWPSQSPELNVIEHMWAGLKRRYDNFVATSKPMMVARIKEIWQDLGQEYAKKLVDSIYNRCVVVIDANGGATRY